MSNSDKTKKSELGKGIRALLNTSQETSKVKRPVSSKTINEIQIKYIQANPQQPRNHFDSQKLQELAESIKIHGLIQPVTVRKLGPQMYQLISGERRLKAAQLAGLRAIPAYVRTANDQSLIEMALVENIQREDLNAVEVAISLQRLLDECNLTHDMLAERVGKDRSTITNYIRILKLPPEIQQAIKVKSLSMGHAKAILSLEKLEDQLWAYKEIVQKNMSVRAAEKWTKNLRNQKSVLKTQKTDLPFEYVQIRQKLMDKFDTKVDLKRNSKGKGAITIHFHSDDDLNHFLEQLDL